MDAVDKRILIELQKDGRLSNQELSERVGLSPSPCSRRVRLLEKNGYIKGYTVLIDEVALGFGISVFVSVKLDKQIDDALKTFETAIKEFPEVVECWLMTGNRDYLIRLATRDLMEYEIFLTTRLNRIPGVASIESSIPLRQVKASIARCN